MFVSFFFLYGIESLFGNSQCYLFVCLQQPVLITDSNLVKPAVEKWTLEYLEKNLGKASHTVFVSRNHKFKYFDDKKIRTKGNLRGVEFNPPTKRTEMKVTEFMKKLKDWKRGDER